MKLYNKIIKLIKSNCHFIILFILFGTITNSFKNFNILLVRDYDERILRAYNYCSGISYGYIKKIKDKYLSNDKKIYIYNFDTSYPSSVDLFNDLKFDERKKNVILLNLKDTNKYKLKDINLDLSKYVLLNKEDNCYYYSKND